MPKNLAVSQLEIWQILLFMQEVYYKIKQNSAKKIPQEVTNLSERARDVGRQILLALEQKLEMQVNTTETDLG